MMQVIPSATCIGYGNNLPICYFLNEIMELSPRCFIRRRVIFLCKLAQVLHSVATVLNRDEISKYLSTFTNKTCFWLVICIVHIDLLYTWKINYRHRNILNLI